MGSVEQSTGGGMGDLNARGGGRGGGRRGRGGEVYRGRSRGNNQRSGGEQYEKRGYNRNHGQQPNHNSNSKDRMAPTDVYQSTSVADFEYDDEQLALNEQIQILKVC